MSRRGCKLIGLASIGVRYASGPVGSTQTFALERATKYLASTDEAGYGAVIAAALRSSVAAIATRVATNVAVLDTGEESDAPHTAVQHPSSSSQPDAERSTDDGETSHVRIKVATQYLATNIKFIDWQVLMGLEI
jgi:hypothetical protein